jgi:hypothetical protein
MHSIERQSALPNPNRMRRVERSCYHLPGALKSQRSDAVEMPALISAHSPIAPQYRLDRLLNRWDVVQTILLLSKGQNKSRRKGISIVPIPHCSCSLSARKFEIFTGISHSDRAEYPEIRRLTNSAPVRDLASRLLPTSQILRP